MVSLIEKGWDPKLKDRGGRTAADYALDCKVKYTLEGCIKRLAFHCFDKNNDGFIDTSKEINSNYFPNPTVVATYDKDSDQKLNRTEYQLLQKDPAYIRKAQRSMCPKSARRSFRLTCPAGASSNDSSTSGDGEQNICKDVQEVLGNATEVLTREQVFIFLRGNLEALQAMVPSEVSVNAVLRKRGKSTRGRTEYVPMLMAATNTHECTDEGHAKIQYLLDQGADPNVVAPDSVTERVIHKASRKHDLKVIQMLEKAGADLNHINRNGYSVLSDSLNFWRGPKSNVTHIEPVVEYLLSKTQIGNS